MPALKKYLPPPRFHPPPLPPYHKKGLACSKAPPRHPSLPGASLEGSEAIRGKGRDHVLCVAQPFVQCPAGCGGGWAFRGSCTHRARTLQSLDICVFMGTVFSPLPSSKGTRLKTPLQGRKKHQVSSKGLWRPSTSIGEHPS